MSQNTAPERPEAIEGEIFNGAVSFAGRLRSGETIASVSSVTEEITNDLAITNKAVTTSSMTINGKTVATGEAVTFKCVGHLAATKGYSVLITVVTDSTPAQTLKGRVTFPVIS